MTITRRQSAGTEQQQSLFGSGSDAPLQIHRLFFAVFPDETVRRRIAQVADGLKLDRAICGRWIDPSRYHMTLHFLGDNSELRQDLVDRASVAAARTVMPAFEFSLDRIAGFRGHKPPGVLRCPEGPTPAHVLWQALRRELMRVGLGAGLEPDFTPHVTLLHCDGAMLEDAAIDPIGWPVREFALVHSVVGQKGYRILGRWLLPD